MEFGRNTKHPCQRGEIGIHSRFKICRPQGHAGSSPAVGTNLERVTKVTEHGIVRAR